MDTKVVVKGNPTWVKGVGGNPSGKPKGAISERSKQWNALSECITGQASELFMQSLVKLFNDDPIVGMRMYLEVLNYFKPRLSSVSNTNLNMEGSTLIMQLNATDVPVFPSNIDEQGNTTEDGVILPNITSNE
jgi:hypothetical protein